MENDCTILPVECVAGAQQEDFLSFIEAWTFYSFAEARPSLGDGGSLSAMSGRTSRKCF